jgi:hypothetical protein
MRNLWETSSINRELRPRGFESRKLSKTKDSKQTVFGDPDVLGFPDPDPLVRGTDPDPAPDPSLL